LIIAPWEWSLLNAAGASVTTSTSSFELAFPASNLFTADKRQPAVFRGGFLVVTGSNDKIDFRGNTKHATLNAGWYRSPAEFAQEIARAMTAADTVEWRWWWKQGSTDRHRFEGGPITGTSTLDILTGTSHTKNSLNLLAGFRNQDRTAASTHTGDFAAIHSRDQVVVDLGLTATAHASFIVGLKSSPDAVVWLQEDSVDPPTASDGIYFPGHADESILALYNIVGSLHRYVGLNINDAANSAAQRTQIGAWWYGPVFNTMRTTLYSIEWEWQSYKRKGELHRAEVDGVLGRPFFSEMAPGETFSVSFASAPGLNPELIAPAQSLMETLGNHGLAFVGLDPVNEPIRETRLCYLTPSPIHRIEGGTLDGCYSMNFDGIIAEVA